MDVETVLVRIADAGAEMEARRRAADLGVDAGFSPAALSDLAIVVTEAVTNLVKHAGGGTLQLRLVPNGPEPMIEVLAIDKGPGMTDVDACLRDGFSTKGTPGTGLGAMQRLSTEFDVYSKRGTGTVVLGRIGRQRQVAFGSLAYGVVKSPAPGEFVCGDAVSVVERHRGPVIVMADGLGHGPAAAQASSAACAVVNKYPEENPATLLERTHAALKPTRGAAVAIASIDLDERKVSYAGLGNISGSLIANGASQHLLSHNGTAGHQAQRIQEFQYPWPHEAVLIMHSDGLTARWDLRNYPMLTNHHPATLAGVLFRDAVRGRDDATILALKER